jgi:CheY-like chemotaxis protein
VRSARILVAEDNAGNRQVLAGYLEMAGHDVHFVRNGAEALEVIDAQPFDLVILDVHMPIKDGLTAAREIRALGGAVAQVPIIALTGDVSRDPAAFAAAGMSAHVTKPVTVEALFDAIDRVGVGRSADGGADSDAASRTAN